MTSFEALGVRDPILQALAAMGYEAPTPVQEAAIPVILSGRDALVEAQTGSGKTTAFAIPAVVAGARGRGLRVLILVPTRELARQVAEETRELGTGSPFRAVAVTGGVQAEQEERTLAGDVRCVVATPGRLLALLEESKIRLEHVELLVLDEADRMLDMGFLADVERVLEACAGRKQTVLVSATLPRDVRELAARHLQDAAEVRVAGAKVPESLEHHRLNVFAEQKEVALLSLLDAEAPERAIVFVATRERAAKLTKLLKKAGLAADALQGEMTHEQRRHVFDLFQRGITRILVATDLASRGLDVPEMQLVVNYDVPEERGAYTHRAGRAARMGRPGKVVTFVLPEEKDDRLRLEREAGSPFAPYRLALRPELVPEEAPPQRRPAKGAAKVPARRAVAKKEAPKKAAQTPKVPKPPKVRKGRHDPIPGARRADEPPPSRKGRRPSKDE